MSVFLVSLLAILAFAMICVDLFGVQQPLQLSGAMLEQYPYPLQLLYHLPGARIALSPVFQQLAPTELIFAQLIVTPFIDGSWIVKSARLLLVGLDFVLIFHYVLWLNSFLGLIAALSDALETHALLCVYLQPRHLPWVWPRMRLMSYLKFTAFSAALGEKLFF